MTEPSLRGGRRSASSAVLVLHGGREHSTEPTRASHLSYLRMLDLYAGLRARSRSCAVYLLRYRVRGWNGHDSAPAPVDDALWALATIRERHPGAPIGLLGHSMGGRTAFAVAATPGVVGICALAPWLPPGEPVPARTDLRAVIAHGTADRMTSPAASAEYALRLQRRGIPVALYEQAGGRHALLDSPLLWHRFAVATTLGLVGDRSLPAGVASELSASTTAPARRSLHHFMSEM